ncbi:eCIS core domain-containing protein [Algoriphagus antarcticus]|uniref:Uncharacterized protein DUF4157 n=1 Tax=Algoriphagus antarcticus TaxID=238540 RepID=A0A3E0DMH0_9BACT|nr:DUF4157 domain-containing protein [Algoriphagus antarcticus]REG84001.1 uncharacterized protein DUF4157 [Algoriphagus antarcticus]
MPKLVFASSGDKTATSTTSDIRTSMSKDPLKTDESPSPFTIQTKLTVGSKDDPLEEEADNMANQVMRMPENSFIQRKCHECEKEDQVHRTRLTDSITPQIQAKGDGNFSVNEASASSIKATLGSGSRLDKHTNNFMSERFGHNFNDVKIHNDSRSAQLSNDLHAKAFTIGKDIYFNQNKYNPASENGKHLLAHELTHTIQQRNKAMRVQKLDLSLHTFSKGSCGERNVQWVFALSNAAPDDGYLVQHIRSLETMAACPSDISYTELAPKLEFWEAWKVKKGDKLDWTTVRDAWTDGSTRPGQPNTSGTQTSLGTIKFFTKAVTGDLGDYGVAPVGNPAWGPGKVPLSGDLTSTATQPSWFSGAATEGPSNRWASSWWNCCGEESKHFSKVESKP